MRVREYRVRSSRSREPLTRAGVKAVVGARNLESGGAGVDDPVLSTSAVAVVAEGRDKYEVAWRKVWMQMREKTYI